MADFIAINEIKKYIDSKYTVLNDKITNINSNLSYWNPVPVNDVKLVKQGTSQEHILFTKTYVSNKTENVSIKVSNLYGACDWELSIKVVSNARFGNNTYQPRVTAGYTLKLNNSTTNIANYNSSFSNCTQNEDGNYEASWIVNNTSQLYRYKKDIMPTDVFNLTTNFSFPSNIAVTAYYQFKIFYDEIDRGNTNPHSVIKRLWHIKSNDFWPIANFDHYANFSTAFYVNTIGDGSSSNPYTRYYHQKLPSALNLNKTEILCSSNFRLDLKERVISYGEDKPVSIIIKEYY